MSGTSSEILCQPNPGIAGTGVVVSYILAAAATVIVPPLASKYRILEKTAASLGITQIITSWAITICGLITYPHSILDPHATVCLALALLGSASHAIPFWLGEFRTKKTSSRLRLGLCVAQTLVLLVAFLVRKRPLNQRTHDDSNDHVNRYETSIIVFMVVTLVWDLALIWSSFGNGEPGCGLRTTNILGAFFLTIFYISTVINLKWKLRDCNMNTGDDNQWTFGQYLALFVLVAPIYSTLEAFLDGPEEQRRTNPDEEQPASNIEMPVIDQSKTNRSGSGPQQDGQLGTGERAPAQSFETLLSRMRGRV